MPSKGLPKGKRRIWVRVLKNRGKTLEETIERLLKRYPTMKVETIKMYFSKGKPTPKLPSLDEHKNHFIRVYNRLTVLRKFHLNEPLISNPKKRAEFSRMAREKLTAKEFTLFDQWAGLTQERTPSRQIELSHQLTAAQFYKTMGTIVEKLGFENVIKAIEDQT